MAIDIKDINQKIKNSPEGYTKAVDQAFYQKVLDMATDIRDHRIERPLILLSGPSGSGKTTTALMIESILDGWGYETHTLSIDNFFIPFSPQEMELVAEGKLDLESPGRVDIPFLNEQLSKILSCEPVELVKYDFKESKRLKTGITLKRKPEDLVILEGTHALNPQVITIPEDKCARIYISVRTRISSGELTLHSKKISLLRRMCRDKHHRGRSLEQTLRMFPKVQHGESKYIIPYRHLATFNVDSFLEYEIAIYKKLLLEELLTLKDNADIKDLISLLENTEPLEESYIPQNSLIREFIGNGQFKY